MILKIKSEYWIHITNQVQSVISVEPNHLIELILIGVIISSVIVTNHNFVEGEAKFHMLIYFPV